MRLFLPKQCGRKGHREKMDWKRVIEPEVHHFQRVLGEFIIESPENSISVHGVHYATRARKRAAQTTGARPHGGQVCR